MEGREAKLRSYAKNTAKGKRLRWWQISKHEFMELIWLKEKDHKKVTNKLLYTCNSENDIMVFASIKDK